MSVTIQPHLSVIIVNYNGRDDLRLCLEALRACPLALEVIVVDNASTDGSAALVRESFSEVRLIAQTENTWFCRGNNIGLEAAQAEYALLLNPDTIPAPDALPLLLNFLRAHPAYAGVTAQLRYPDGGIQRTCSRRPTYAYLLANHTPLVWLRPGWRARLNAAQWYADWSRQSDRDVEVVPGSCIMMRRAALWLDDDLLLYFPEDTLAAPGRVFRFVAAARIVHREKSVTRSWLATRIYFRDLLVYTRKQHGSASAALLWLLSRPLLWGMALKRALVKGSTWP
jgi:hypothetical protein